MTLIESTRTCLGLFLPFSPPIVIIIFALVILRLVVILVLAFSFLLFALLPLHFVFVFFFNKLNLTVYFLLLFLGSCFCFIDERSTEPTVFQVSWADIKVVLLVC